MIKSALIGCGLVADQHLAQIQRVPGGQVVGVCDTEPLMARQLADRFHVPNFFSDAAVMLKTVRPDVVHITTPAQTHFPLGKLCLESGCHVYMEKPFSVTAPQAEELLGLAESKGMKMTVGHNLQFNPEAIRMRALVQSGFLGGAPTHIDCVQCFSHDDPTYGKALLGDRTHWVRSLPGSLLQNLISHGLAKIAEFLPVPRPTVMAHAYSSPYLRSLGQTDVLDELRAIISAGDNTTAFFTFSTQLGVGHNHICLYGKKGTVIADCANRMLIPIQPKGYKSYLRYFLTPLIYAGYYRRNSWHNVKRFLKKDFHMDYSMKMLIQLFYQSIQEKTPPPIPYREILTTAWMMDDIFAQIRKAA
ncbi:MAG: Gfo/Idh/MocA family oxidoreductase [Verrucomicrobiota bacterium]|jgi:predicted dehydrogenase